MFHITIEYTVYLYNSLVCSILLNIGIRYTIFSMNQELEQVQKQERMLEKANILVTNNRVRRSPCKESRNIWMVSSYSTPKKWYVVRWNEDIDGFTCACKAIEYSSNNACMHILAACFKEGGGD